MMYNSSVGKKIVRITGVSKLNILLLLFQNSCYILALGLIMYLCTDTVPVTIHSAHCSNLCRLLSSQKKNIIFIYKILKKILLPLTNLNNLNRKQVEIHICKTIIHRLRMLFYLGVNGFQKESRHSIIIVKNKTIELYCLKIIVNY